MNLTLSMIRCILKDIECIKYIIILLLFEETQFLFYFILFFKSFHFFLSITNIFRYIPYLHEYIGPYNNNA